MNVQRQANSMKTLKLSGSRGDAASAFLAVAFATLGLQGTASAQGVTSVIRGTITDASGAVVQAAALTVTDVTKGRRPRQSARAPRNARFRGSSFYRGPAGREGFPPVSRPAAGSGRSIPRSRGSRRRLRREEIGRAHV